jgi:hypothetical protein
MRTDHGGKGTTVIWRQRGGQREYAPEGVMAKKKLKFLEEHEEFTEGPVSPEEKRRADLHKQLMDLLDFETGEEDVIEVLADVMNYMSLPGLAQLLKEVAAIVADDVAEIVIDSEAQRELLGAEINPSAP